MGPGLASGHPAAPQHPSFFSRSRIAAAESDLAWNLPPSGGHTPLPSTPSAAMTPAEQAAQKPQMAFFVSRRQRGGRNVVQVSSSVSEMEALRARIRSQSKAVAEHIAADAEAQAFLDDWATPEPLSH